MKELIVLAVLIPAAVFDVRWKKIPNAFWITGSVICLANTFFQSGIYQAAWSVCVFLILICICFPLYLLRAVGAGDIKLVGFLGAVLETQDFVRVILIFLALSGSAAFWVLCRRGLVFRRLKDMLISVFSGSRYRCLRCQRESGSADITMVLAPFLAIAYFALLIGRRWQIC